MAEKKDIKTFFKKLKQHKVNAVVIFTYSVSIITIIGFFFGIFQKLNHQGALGMMLISIICITALFDGMLVRRNLNKRIDSYIKEYADLKNAFRYAGAFEHINTGFAKVHAIFRLKAIGNQQEFNVLFPIATKETICSCLVDVCSSLSKVFSDITNHPCAVCIKIIHKSPEGDLLVKTLCRDSSHISRDFPELSRISHRIIDNTDFKEILNNIGNPNKQYFFSNNLPGLFNYENSSFAVHGGRLPDNTTPKQRSILWKLPYRSSVIVPICPNLSEEWVKENIIGFLCVDSPETNVFNEKIDKHILMGIADPVYNIMKVITLLP